MSSKDDVTRVEYSRKGSIAYIYLNGPAKLNALADESIIDFEEAFFQFDADEEALVGIIHGAGRAFCSGADVVKRQLRATEDMQRLGSPEGRAKLSTFWFEATQHKPLIAAVHGYATGYGFLIALLCEMLVAEEDTKFQVTELSRGLGGIAHRSVLYERGAGRIADDLTTTGRFCDVREGFEGGFVHRVVPHGTHLEAAEAVAEEVMANPPLSVRTMVQYRRSHIEMAWAEGRAAGPRGLHMTEDFRESARAFVEKRKPVYKGR